jgi:hypothetical protein
MANKSTADVILAIREHSNTVRRQVVTDTEVLKRANEGLWELYDLIDGAHGTYFVKPFLFSLIGGYGANAAPLPTDFYRAKAVDYNPDTSAMCSVDPLPSFAERNNVRKRSYDLEDVGDISIYPPPTSAGAYRLLYIPKCPQLGAAIVVQSTNPPPPLTSPLPIPSRAMTWIKLASQQLGSLRLNQQDILAQVVTAWLSLGTWVVMRSSNGSAITTTNQWTTGGAMATGAWIQMRNLATNVQVVISITVGSPTAWLEQNTYTSAAVGFTGGTPTARPTATDEAIVTNVLGGDWLGTACGDGNPNPLFRAFVQGSTDGTKLRVVWVYTAVSGASFMKAFWQFDTIGSPVGGTWVPFVSLQWDNGNDTSSGAPLIVPDNLNGRPVVFTNAGHVEFLDVGTESAIAGYHTTHLAQDENTLQYFWVNGHSMVVEGMPAGRNGILGYATDQWWIGRTAPADTTPVFPDGDTAGGKGFVFFGQMMLQWDGTAVPGFAGSTDRPAASFYGRSTL